MNKKLFYFIFVSNFIFCKDVYAYLDSGTGSIIIQAIVVFLALALGFLSYWWKKVKEGSQKLIFFFEKKKK
jgi:hypothetical protein